MIKSPMTARIWNVCWPVIVAFVICGVLSTTLYLSASASDVVASEREQKLVDVIVSKLQGSVAHDQESATVWDDAVKNTRLSNYPWMETNLGVWMNTYFGHDAAIVLGPDLTPKYQFFAEPPPLSDITSSYLPLALKLKERILAGDTSGTNNRILSVGEANLELLGSRPAIISVKPIISDTGEISQTPDDVSLHVAIRYLDGDMPRVIGNEYQLEDFHFATEAPSDPKHTNYALTSSSGQAMGFFIWKAFEPGAAVTRAMFPVLVGSFMAIFATASLAGNVISKRSQRLERSRQELLYQARHDGLTGLANRVEFTEKVAHAGSKAKATDTNAVLFVDLDKFKQVNDTLGHPAGDALIMQAAQRLRQIAPQGVVGRIGGDEFTVFIRLEQDEGASSVADDIVKAMSAPFEIHGKNVLIGASVGVCTVTGAFSASEIIRKADIALYHAKAAGKNTFAIFGTHMDDIVQKRRRLENDLRHALTQQGQLQVFYQPVFSGRSGRICSVEALARWCHPEFGYINPETFIPLAEEAGLIEQIGEIVLDNACDLLSRHPELDVALNASPVELCSASYPLRVISTLEKYSVASHRLEIEITESATAADGRWEQNVAALRAIGIKFAIDDFGTGYSSFARVQKVAADRIKIDKSFINEIKNADSKALVVAMINVARAKGLKVTAEGVETVEQRDELIEMECDHLQGFLYSKPVPIDQIEKLLSYDRTNGQTSHAIREIASTC